MVIAPETVRSEWTTRDRHRNGVDPCMQLEVFVAVCSDHRLPLFEQQSAEPQALMVGLDEQVDQLVASNGEMGNRAPHWGRFRVALACRISDPVRVSPGSAPKRWTFGAAPSSSRWVGCPATSDVGGVVADDDVFVVAE